MRELLAIGDTTPGEFRTPPVAESPYVEDQAFIGAIRLLQGEREAGTALLEAAATRAAARPAGAGNLARRWNDVFALALPDRPDERRAAYRHPVATGLLTDPEFPHPMPAL